MTSSIPLSLPEASAAPGLPAAVPGTPAGGPGLIPDFAGLLAGVGAVATPPALPGAAPAAPTASGLNPEPAAVLPAAIAAGGILGGFPMLPPEFPAPTATLPPVAATAAAADESAGATFFSPRGQNLRNAYADRPRLPGFSPVSGPEMPAQPEEVGNFGVESSAATPTRDEQEAAVALLAAFFPATPPPAAALPLTVAGTDRPELASGPDTGCAERISPTPTGPVELMAATAGVAPRVVPEANVSAPAPRVSVSREGDPVPSDPRLDPKTAATDAVPAEKVPECDPAENLAVRTERTDAAASSGCTLVEAAVVRPDGVRLARRTAFAPGKAQAPASLAEKSAGPRLETDGPGPVVIRSFGKKLLSTSEQRVAEDGSGSGTTVAKAGASMSPHSSNTFVAVAPGAGASPRSAEPAAPSTEVAARREAAELAAPRVISTVQEVVEAQEASKLRPVPAVHLRMQVAGETIGIKVELRDDTVQTRFTTVSPELREALTREWQAARSESPAGATRLLDPEFPAAPAGGGAASLGQDAASQQHQQARAWGFPWQQAAAQSAARRPRPAGSPETTPDTELAIDSRLFSAVA